MRKPILICRSCGEPVAVSAFYPSEIRSRLKRCPACCRARAGGYYTENRDAVLAIKAAKRLADPEKYTAQSLAWQRSNPEKMESYRERKNALGREYSKLYHHSHRKQHAAQQRVRNHLRRGDGSFTQDDVTTLYSIQEGRCFYCDKEVGKVYHVDHWMPVSKGGANTSGNIVIACPPCNLSKSSRLPWDFGAVV